MKYSHGTCLENKFGELLPACKDNAVHSLIGSGCPKKKGAGGRDRYY